MRQARTRAREELHETDMTDDVMTIRAMCDAFGVTPRALRFYEAKALLSPIRVGQKRLYTRRDRARLKLILRGKRFGFSLEEIRRLLDLYDRESGNVAQLRAAIDAGTRRLAELEAQRAELDVVIDELREALATGETMLAGVGDRTEAA
jgi:DNA-binding transcriptional MerR regulator